MTTDTEKTKHNALNRELDRVSNVFNHKSECTNLLIVS